MGNYRKDLGRGLICYGYIFFKDHSFGFVERGQVWNQEDGYADTAAVKQTKAKEKNGGGWIGLEPRREQ